MARIKLFGVQELIPLENKDAKKVDGMWKDDEIDKEREYITGKQM